MESKTAEKTAGWGGERVGAGRPKGAKNKHPNIKKEKRLLTMRAEVWALADSLMARKRLTRPQFFEQAVYTLAQEEEETEDAD